jgi:hypothetical protein
MTQTWQQFGTALLDQLDLDPVYVMLHTAQLEESLLQEWLLAYTMFYDCGTASRIAAAPDFWAACLQAYTEKWPRGAERRHFRGQQCLDSIRDLLFFNADPAEIVKYWSVPRTFSGVAARVQQFVGYGPWIAWKVADMLERVMCVPIDFSSASLAMYQEPVRGASLILYGEIRDKLTEAELQQAVDRVLGYFYAYKAPPRFDRPLNIAECETLFCKYKSHVNGHYVVPKDSLEIAESLMRIQNQRDGAAELARRLLCCVPNVGLQQATLFG